MKEYGEIAEILNLNNFDSSYLINLAILYIKAYKGLTGEGELKAEYEPAILLLSLFLKDKIKALNPGPVIKSEKADTHSIEYATAISTFAGEVPEYITNLLDRINDNTESLQDLKDTMRVRGY